MSVTNSISDTIETPSLARVSVPTTLLIVANIILMYLVAATPLATINRYMFSIPIIGVLIYGAMIGLGEHVAKKSLNHGDNGLAIAGIVLLQIAYGLFGGGVLSYAPRDLHLPALVVTLVVTVILTLVLVAYIYLRNADFSHWDSWSSGAFLIGIVLALVGSAVTPVLLVAFVFIFVGFILELGWEIWKVRDEYNADEPLTHSVGIYVAFTGVFVHILQLVLRAIAED